MTSGNINSFVGDLVEMAKAMERLPSVEAENSRLQDMVESYAKQVQALELRAIDRIAEISGLHDRIRSLEVERDDASFRVLEAEDKAHHVLNWVRDTQALMGQVIGELDPPKPEPVKEPEASPLPVSEITDVTASSGVGSQEAAKTLGEQSSISPASQGSSEPNPTTNATDGEPKSEQTSVTSSANEGATSGQSESPPTSATTDNTSATQDAYNAPVDQAVSPINREGPYFGKKYRNVEGYVSYHDWIGGGGTHEGYWAGRS